MSYCVKLFTGIIVGLGVLLMHTAPLAQPTVIVVRHGEKADDSKDPALSAYGEARAARLASLLARSGLRAIYTTQFRRTQLQAQPLARLTGIVPITFPASDGAGLVKLLLAHSASEVVLVVGHSNTVPAIVKALGVKEDVKVADDEFDNLFIVTPRADHAVVLHLKY
jgi:broad specificity phosphatase PhoE